MTITLNTSTSKLIDGDYTPSDQFESEISEQGGHFYKEDQILIFDNNGMKMDVIYIICVDGCTITDSGDWMTPAYSFVEINNVDITIKEVRIEGFLVETTSDMDKVFVELINKTI